MGFKASYEAKFYFLKSKTENQAFKVFSDECFLALKSSGFGDVLIFGMFCTNIMRNKLRFQAADSLTDNRFS